LPGLVKIVTSLQRQSFSCLLASVDPITLPTCSRSPLANSGANEHEGWARRFFENWRASLKPQRLKPYEKFADTIDRHWDGIAAYRKLENKVSLAFAERLNNKIRTIQRRAYGICDEAYLHFKICTCMLPMLRRLTLVLTRNPPRRLHEDSKNYSLY